ncbi:CGNR zinc finger domain-containing protein [Streptomyces sp. NBC_00059]|uniref:CGNR zinc finger domain-containing protein n=1 Tax=Streptomyces sp. NBC_00059 TaxID=2975635 RepID=UPI00224FDE6E|nr:CGNR zinc finger domain-containing protein [Streptomyces sp. NBC_00059]MCX5416804.1 CGNR zinc finger domain-containing protein [Streptomyces sp. NBC_00059]
MTAALVNVTAPGMRRSRPYSPPEGEALAEAVSEVLIAGNRHARAVDAGEAARLMSLAHRLHAVFVHLEGHDTDGAVGVVNALFADLRPVPRLDRRAGEPWHLYFRSPEDDLAGDVAAQCGIALATALGSRYAERLGICSAPACDGVYVDVSRNGTRRFCSTACQNRVKAAAHRARH